MLKQRGVFCFEVDLAVSEISIVLLRQDTAHQSEKGFCIREDSDYMRATLQFLVESFQMVAGSEEPAHTFRNDHHCHGAVKAFIQALHGLFSTTTVLTFRLEIPLTTISAMAAIRAASLRE